MPDSSQSYRLEKTCGIDCVKLKIMPRVKEDQRVKLASTGSVKRSWVGRSRASRRCWRVDEEESSGAV